MGKRWRGAAPARNWPTMATEPRSARGQLKAEGRVWTVPEWNVTLSHLTEGHRTENSAGSGLPVELTRSQEAARQEPTSFKGREGQIGRLF